jgi:hypothetical protein
MKLRVKTNDGFELSTICRQLKLDIYLSHLENKHDGYLPISSIVEEISLPNGQEYLSLTAEAVEEYHVNRKRKR